MWKGQMFRGNNQKKSFENKGNFNKPPAVVSKTHPMFTVLTKKGS